MLPPRRYLPPLLLAFLLSFISTLAAGDESSRIQPNSNQAPAGALSGTTLTIHLELRSADWFPESDTGPSFKVFAFSESGKAPQVPGPLIRVPQGTSIHAIIQNFLPTAAVVHGMHSRPGKTDDVLQIPPGETRDVTFLAGDPGAYYYWASAGGDTWNGRPYKEDSQLSGAFLVDPPGAVLADRVFVLGIWRNKQLPDQSLDIPVINGKSWPYTERLQYTAGTEVRWHWLNPSNLPHPMHMHGSYYRVDSLGDGEQDIRFADDNRKLVVTQMLAVGQTMTTDWVPSRAGHWIFHCHTLAHISPEIMMTHEMSGSSSISHAGPSTHMAGLITAINVLPRPGEHAFLKPPRPRRRLELVVTANPSGPNTRGYALLERGKPTLPAAFPGPPIVLTRGEPVVIRVTNHLNEPTAVHWHGIELESYYDGVPGYTGDDQRVTPMIMPGKSFDVHFAPPRAGTFIYHTHMKDLSQLSSGLYGPLIVLAPGETFHPDTDRIFIVARNGIHRDGNLLLNGSHDLQPLTFPSGVPTRFRFINLGPNTAARITLSRDGNPVSWTAIAKDGADLPAAQSLSALAQFSIAPGETYDFQLPAQPSTAAPLSLTIENVIFKEMLTQSIQLSPP